MFFWDVTHRILVVTNVSGQPFCLIFVRKAFHEEDCLTFGGGTGRVSRILGNKAPIYDAYGLRRAQIYFTARWESAVTANQGT